MSIRHQVLGQPGRDNAVTVTIDSGQRQVKILFDCGEGCLSDLGVSEIREFDHVCFSHFHMDHIAGFDGFFRCTYNRPNSPIDLWGPPGTIDLMQHRFRGFLWNLHQNQPGTWRVHEILDDRVAAAEFYTHEAFETRHDLPVHPNNDLIFTDPDFTLHAIRLEHHGPSIGYRIDEAPSLNVDPVRLEKTGLRPGPWLEVVKNNTSELVNVHGETCEVAPLREQLLIESPGDSFAYLTDFKFDPAIFPQLDGCDQIVCEAQYRHDDIDLATKNHHSTTQQVATLAKLANVDQLTLFHLSERYRPSEWLEMLKEAQQIFPKTQFPAHWEIVESP